MPVDPGGRKRGLRQAPKPRKRPVPPVTPPDQQDRRREHIPEVTHPDQAARQKQARKSNFRRGAAPTGGPGRRDVRETNALITRYEKGKANTAEVQRHLRRKGFDLAVDNQWGPQTQEAWKTYLRGVATGQEQHAVEIFHRQRDYLRDFNPDLPANAAYERQLFGPQGHEELNRLRANQLQARYANQTNPNAPHPRDVWDKAPVARGLRALGGAIGGKVVEDLGELWQGDFAGAYAEEAELLTGPEMIKASEGKDFDPRWLAFEAALIPFRPIATLRAAGAGAWAARKGVKAAKTAAKTEYHGPGLAYRADRRFKVGDEDFVKEPSRSAFGRSIDRAIDRVANTEKQAGRRMGARTRFEQSTKNVTVNLLRKATRGLNDAQEYALRVLAEGRTPEERIAHHVKLAETAPRQELKLYHMEHAAWSKQAAKYVQLNPAWQEGMDVSVTPRIILQPSVKGHTGRALRRLEKSWGYFQQTGELRQDLLKEIGRLQDDRIMYRLHAPGRVIGGARFKTFEREIQEQLEADPARQAAFEWAEREFADDPVQMQAAKSMYDSVIRSVAEETGMPVSEVAGRIGQVTSKVELDEIPELGAFYQTVNPTEHIPGILPFREMAENVLRDIPKNKLPEGLRTPAKLARKIDEVYTLVRQGADYKDWYVRAARVWSEVADELGIDRVAFAKVVGIYSQQANPTENLRRALTAVKQYRENDGVISIGITHKNGRNYQAEKAKAVLEGGEWAGRKTNSYFGNALKHLDPELYAKDFTGREVTVDRHIADMIDGSDNPGSHYDGIERIFQEIADTLGWGPEEVQAAAWVPWKARTLRNKQLKKGTKAMPEEGYMPSAGDAYERGQAKYKGELYQRLKGLPETGRNFGPNEEVQAIATDYMDVIGQEYKRPERYVEDTPLGPKIADEYELMPHAPDDPAVAESYQAMIEETFMQYQALVKAGYRFEFPDGEYPYKSPWDAMADLRENKHLYVFPTEAGFGSSDNAFANHPLLVDSGIQWNGRPVTHNDIFRAVHDVFGHHKEGVGFRAAGEDNAWRQHSAMYSEKARGAMTSETRGQNSWVNFGPHSKANLTANEVDTVYADQKAGLLPNWVIENGVEDPMRLSDDYFPKGWDKGNRDLEYWYKSYDDASTTAIDRLKAGMPIDGAVTMLRRDLEAAGWKPGEAEALANKWADNMGRSVMGDAKAAGFDPTDPEVQEGGRWLQNLVKLTDDIEDEALRAELHAALEKQIVEGQGPGMDDFGDVVNDMLFREELQGTPDLGVLRRIRAELPPDTRKSLTNEEGYLPFEDDSARMAREVGGLLQKADLDADVHERVMEALVNGRFDEAGGILQDFIKNPHGYADLEILQKALNALGGKKSHQAFQEAAAEELQNYAAMARDVANTLPEEEWPVWVRNQIRAQAEEFPDISRRTTEGEYFQREGFTEADEARLAEVNAEYDKVIRRLQKEVNPYAPGTYEQARRNRTGSRRSRMGQKTTGQETRDLAEDELTKRAKTDPKLQKLIDEQRELTRKRDDWQETLFQRQQGIRGAVQFDENDLARIFLTDKADVITLAHELAHVMRRLLPKVSPNIEQTIARFSKAKIANRAERSAAKKAGKPMPRAVYEWDVMAEEGFAQSVEKVLRTGVAPRGRKREFAALAKVFQKEIEQLEVPDVPFHVHKAIQKLMFDYEPKAGGRIFGAEDVKYGVSYAPTWRGVPFRMTHPHRAMGAYIRGAQSHFFGGGRGRAVGGGPDDQALRKSITGALLISGFFQKDVVGPLAESGILATRMSGAAVAHTALKRAGSPIPKNADDIAVKIDPTKELGDEIKRFWDKTKDFGNRKLSVEEFDPISFELVEAARRTSIPFLPGHAAERDEMQKLAEKAIDLQEPIDNIVWVPKEFMDASGLLYVPQSAKYQDVALRNWMRKGGLTWDVVNDLVKAQILWLNPAYAPAQFIGNTAMNLMHQGPFAMVSGYKSVMMLRNMPLEHRLTIDTWMGEGIGGIIKPRGPLQGLETLHRWNSVASDIFPRRMAFMHEARRDGYKTFDEINDLAKRARAGDQEAITAAEKIAQRARRSIVDFDNLTPFEREVVSRWIFFYPWLRAASDYSVNFIKDHPLQAATLALMYEHMKGAQQDILGDHPYYSNLDVPISTESVGLKVPFTDAELSLSDVAGEHTLETMGPDGEPIPSVFKLRQAFTQTTPLEIAAALKSWSLEWDSPESAELVNFLTPTPYGMAVALFGYDPYEGKEVPRGPLTFLNQVGITQDENQAIPVVDRIRKLFFESKEQAEERRKNALYPREKVHEAVRVPLGSLAPTPYNPRVGQERAMEDAPTLERKTYELKQDGEELDLPPPSKEALEDLKWNIELYKGWRGLSPLEKAKRSASLHDKRYRTNYTQQYVPKIRTEGEAVKMYEAINPRLYPRYGQYRSWIRKRKDMKLDEASVND